MQDTVMEPQQRLENPHLKLMRNDLKVRVTAELDGSGQPKYELEAKGKKTDKLDLARDSGSHNIIFDLDTRLDLRFDATEPFLAAKTGGSCPDTLDRNQFMVDRCDAKRLVVIDWNYGIEADYNFKLNFVNSEGMVQKAYDPIIQNGGGIKPPGP